MNITEIYLDQLQNENILHEGKIFESIKSLNYKKMKDVYNSLKLSLKNKNLKQMYATLKQNGIKKQNINELLNNSKSKLPEFNTCYNISKKVIDNSTNIENDDVKKSFATGIALIGSIQKNPVSSTKTILKRAILMFESEVEEKEKEKDTHRRDLIIDYIIAIIGILLILSAMYFVTSSIIYLSVTYLSYPWVSIALSLILILTLISYAMEPN